MREYETALKRIKRKGEGENFFAKVIEEKLEHRRGLMKAADRASCARSTARSMSSTSTNPYVDVFRTMQMSIFSITQGPGGSLYINFGT